MKDVLINTCLSILKREDVKNEFKNLTKPLVNIILIEIYPYIYLCLIFVIISFLLMLAIFILLLKNEKFSIPRIKLI
jgi:hypothetical protein